MEMYKKIFTIIFMVTLLGFSAMNMYYAKGGLKHALTELESPKSLKDVKTYTLSIDNILATNLLFDNQWNETYAKVYNFFGKNEENSFSYVRDKDGMLYQGNFWNTSPIPVKEYALRIKRLQTAVEDKGTKVVVLLYPTQYNKEWSDGYYGIPYNDYNLLSEEMVSLFRYYGIDCIDYKRIYLQKKMRATEIFYKTDHHWRVEVAFDGFCTLVEHLNKKYDEKLDTYYTDINNYNVETYENWFIGSQGRDAGVNYVGLDDYTFIIPKFDTDYKYVVEYKSGESTEHNGDIEETLISKEYLYEEDYYDREMWGSYLGGVHVSDRIENKLNSDGLSALFIRDSYSSPLATFFSSYCSEIDMLWTAEVDANTIEETVENGDYDYIFIGLAVDSYIHGDAEFYVDEEDTNE